jgi:spore maturation protein CgeB
MCCGCGYPGDIIEKVDPKDKPDIFILSEGVLDFFPKGIEKLSIPTVWYAIDQHIHLYIHLIQAGLFDFVFIAMKDYIEKFREAGCRNVYWLPLACDPDVHRKFDVEKIYDISFVGNIFEKVHDDRRKLIERLSRRFDLNLQKDKFLDEVALIYSQSKIVFNKSANNDLNMRVFEALSSGSMLLTDRLDDAVALRTFLKTDGTLCCMMRIT